VREAGITELRGSEEWPVPARVSHRVRWSRARAVAPFRPLSNRSPNGSAGWIRAVPDLSPLMPLRRASPMPRWAVISNDLICSAETGVDTCMGRSWAWAVQRQLLPVPPHPPCATNREWQPYRSRTCQAIQSRNTSLRRHGRGDHHRASRIRWLFVMAPARDKRSM